MIEIIGTKETRTVRELSGEKSLLALLQEEGLAPGAPCGGRGVCGRCRVRFLEGVTEPTEQERRLLTEDELAEGVRLACEARVSAPCRIRIEPDDKNLEVLLDGEEGAPVSSVSEDSRAGWSEADCAIAVDIGTTTLAAELFCLKDGRTLATVSGVNSQRAYGADVLSRILASNEGKGALLRACMQSDILKLMEQLLKNTGHAVPVRRLALVGNTAMCHLLRGLSCQGLGRAPFTPTDHSLFQSSAAKLLGSWDWEAEATILPGISAFVGADFVAGVFANGLISKKEPCLLLDIGTNGEMGVWDGEKLLVTSAPAGPVFEGGTISCGIPGIPGAISHTAYWGGRFLCETIGEQPPIGICGSGMIDLVSELAAHGYVDRNGTLKEPWFTNGISLAEGVSFLQKDVREVQMGKAAIRAGIEVLLSAAGMKKEECAQIFLAGGFGYFIHEQRAIRLGLLPQEFSGKLKHVGNSALKGAKRFLLQNGAGERELAQICARAEEVSLANHPLFQETYVSHMLL